MAGCLTPGSPGRCARCLKHALQTGGRRKRVYIRRDRSRRSSDAGYGQSLPEEASMDRTACARQRGQPFGREGLQEVPQVATPPVLVCPARLSEPGHFSSGTVSIQGSESMREKERESGQPEPISRAERTGNACVRKVEKEPRMRVHA